MTQSELAELVALEQSSSKPPWHTLHVDDDMCMSAIVVTKNPSTARELYDHARDWPASDVVAACLVQSPTLAVSDDRLWHQNARLIGFVLRDRC